MKRTKFITRKKGILGGDPVIVGTRIPVERVLFLLEEGYTHQLIRKEFPHVSLRKIKGAVAELASIGFSQI